MAILLGKNAALYWDTDKMARINSFNVTVNGVAVDTTELGDDWESSRIVINNWSGSLEGYFDLSDSQQNIMHSRAISGGEVGELKYYEEDGGSYWQSDTATDADATAFVESYTWNVDKSGVLTFSMGIKGSGPIARTAV